MHHYILVVVTIIIIIIIIIMVWRCVTSVWQIIWADGLDELQFNLRLSCKKSEHNILSPHYHKPNILHREEVSSRNSRLTDTTQLIFSYNHQEYV